MNRRISRVFLFTLVLMGSLMPTVQAYTAVSAGRSAGGGVQVTQTFPPDMANAVSPTTPLTVEFGGTVSQAFYQTINLNLFQGNKLVDGEMFYNPSARQIMFKSKKPLQDGNTYTAHLTFADGAGGNSEKVWNFRVGGTAHVSAGSSSEDSAGGAYSDASPRSAGSLRIVQASMAAGSVETQKPLEITFSEPLDLVSLREAPVRLVCGKTSIGIDYRLSRDRQTLTMIPRTSIQTGKDYGITLSQALRGNSGSRLPKNTIIQFQLVDAQANTDVMPNVIEETSPETSSVQTGGFENPFGGNSGNFKTAQTPARRALPAVPNAPLRLVGLSPQNGQTVNSLSVPVSVAFSSELRAETLNEFTFRLEDDFGPVPAKIRYFPGRKVGTLTPIGVLDAQKTYRVVITQGITDVAGQPLQKGMTATFSTTSRAISPEVPEMFAAAPNRATRVNGDNALRSRAPSRSDGDRQNYQEPDQESAELESMGDPIQRPASSRSQNSARRARDNANSNSDANSREGLSTFKVSQIMPGSNAQAVARDARIFVYFSEDANPSTLNPVNISIFGEQRRVEGKVIYDSRRRCALFIPAARLKSDTEYKVIISDKIRSSRGERLCNRVSWQFVTSGENGPSIQARRVYEADASFDIPLLDGRNPRRGNPAPARTISGPRHTATLAVASTSGGSGSAFNFLPENHWSFKSLRRVASKGLLSDFPFRSTSGITRYEFANAVNSALGTLKSLRNNPKMPRLKVADLVELQQLVVEYRGELRSYRADTTWFEKFMERQGIRLQDVERRVAALNGRSSG